MTPELVQGMIAALGTFGAIWAGWTARKKVSAEAEKALAERDSVIVKSATGAVDLANRQMATLLDEQKALRETIEEYRLAVQKATSAEQHLRMELGKVKKRVQVLEEYIQKNGLAIPD